jgi:hypothetical protein
MELKPRKSKEEIIHQHILLDDYGRFRKLLKEKDITVNRLDWQPLVMLEKYWSRNDLFDLLKQLKQYPELNSNLAVELFDYHQYKKDIRYSKKMFAELQEFDTAPLIYVFYPRSYNAKSLTSELNRLELVSYSPYK